MAPPIEIEFGKVLGDGESETFSRKDSSKPLVAEKGSWTLDSYQRGARQRLGFHLINSSDDKGGVVSYSYFEGFLNIFGGAAPKASETLLIVGEEAVVRTFTDPRDGTRIGFRARHVPAKNLEGSASSGNSNGA